MKISDNIIEQVETCEISINHVDKSFGSGESLVIALKEINLHISHGEFVCLLGHQDAVNQRYSMLSPVFLCQRRGKLSLKVTSLLNPVPIEEWCFKNMRCFHG